MYVYRLVYAEYADSDNYHHVMTFSREYTAEALASKLNYLLYVGKFMVKRDLVSDELGLLNQDPDDDAAKDAGG